MVLLAKDKSNTIEVLLSITLLNSFINHDEFVSMNNMLRENDDMKEAVKNLKISAVYQKL